MKGLTPSFIMTWPRTFIFKIVQNGACWSKQTFWFRCLYLLRCKWVVLPSQKIFNDAFNNYYDAYKSLKLANPLLIKDIFQTFVKIQYLQPSCTAHSQSSMFNLRVHCAFLTYVRDPVVHKIFFWVAKKSKYLNDYKVQKRTWMQWRSR